MAYKVNATVTLSNFNDLMFLVLQDKSKSCPVGPEMSSEQKEKIIGSDEFMTFFDRASRVVERALCEPSDIFFDHIAGTGEEGR